MTDFVAIDQRATAAAPSREPFGKHGDDRIELAAVERAIGPGLRDQREEFILASDVLGLSMLVVQMNHAFDAKATPATVLGPFHIDGSPEKEFGGDMSDGLPGTPGMDQARRVKVARLAKATLERAEWI